MKTTLRRKILPALVVAGMLVIGSVVGQPTPRVAFIPQIVGIPYFNAMEIGGNRAAEQFGAAFIYQGPTTTSPADQLRIFDSLIEQGVEAISISVLDQTSINPAIERARQRGLHVFTSDSDAPNSAREVYVAQAFDDELGFAIIDGLASRLGEQGKIGIVSGEPTATNLNTWIMFMRQQVAERYPNLEIVDVRFAGGSADAAFQLATDLMTAFPDLRGLVAVASTTCPGVGQAVEAAGKIGQVLATGFCSPNTARSFIKSGAMPFTVLWDPDALGYLTVWAGLQLINGTPFQAVNQVPGLADPVRWFEDRKILLLGPPAVFTAENVDQFNF